MTTTKTPAPARSRARASASTAAAKATSVTKAKPAVAAAKPAVKAVAKPVAKPKATPVKATLAKATPAKAAPAPAEPSVGEAAAALVGAVSEALSIRKKELVERVVIASGAKKKQVKDIVEHTLKVLGDALAKGEELNIPPFGKAKVNRARENDKGKTMVVKVKRGVAAKGGGKAKQGIAAADD